MAWNGTGTYILPPAYSPEINGTVIDATRYNGLTTDVASGITNCLAKDGQNTPTANIPWGGFKITGLAAAAALGDALSFGRAATLTDLTTTGNTILGDATTDTITLNGTATIVSGTTVPRLGFLRTAITTWFVGGPVGGGNGFAIGQNANDFLTIDTSGNLATTGNVVLGDAITDTLNVGNGGFTKNAASEFGINCTPVAAVPLRIQQAGNNDIGFDIVRNTATEIILQAYNRATPGYGRLRFEATDYDFGLLGGTSTLFINTAGNVGIGSTATTRSLEINRASAGLKFNSTTAANQTVIEFAHNGTSYDFLGSVGTAGDIIAGSTAVDLAYRSQGGRHIWSVDSGATISLMLDAVGRLSGLGLHNNASAPSGTTRQYIASGTYTPTFVAGTNCTGVTIVGTWKWIRVGNVVTVAGQATAARTAGAGTATQYTATLPLSSTFVAGSIAGTGVTAFASGLSEAAQVSASGNLAQIGFGSSTAGAGQPTSIVFQYEVL